LARRASGVSTSGLPVSMRLVSRAPSPNTPPRLAEGFWPLSTTPCLPVLLAGAALAAALGDADVQYVWRFLRTQKIDLSRRKSWCESVKGRRDHWAVSQSPTAPRQCPRAGGQSPISRRSNVRRRLKLPNGRGCDAVTDYRETATQPPRALMICHLTHVCVSTPLYSRWPYIIRARMPWWQVQLIGDAWRLYGSTEFTTQLDRPRAVSSATSRRSAPFGRAYY
jgi:hypothetical protein